MRHFYLIVIYLSLLTGCSLQGKPKTACVQRDWYEIGRQDGRIGESIYKLENWSTLCPKTMKKEVYKLGYRKGLKNYCSPGNAYELGKSGVAYKNVCQDSQTRRLFLRSYNDGENSLIDKEKADLNFLFTVEKI